MNNLPSYITEMNLEVVTQDESPEINASYELAIARSQDDRAKVLEVENYLDVELKQSPFSNLQRV